MKRVIVTERARTSCGNGRHLSLALRRVLGVVLLSTMLGSGASAFANVLKSVQAIEESDGATSLVLEMSDPAATPRTFSTTTPPRIIMDLAGASSGLKRHGQFISAGVVKNMQVVEAQGRTRLIFDLTRTVPHDVGVEGNRIRVVLGGQAELALPVEDPAQPQLVKTATTESGITNIDFRRGKESEGRIEITFSDDRVAADVRKSGEQIVARFSGVVLPEELERRFDVTDFGTPVVAIDAFRRGAGAELVITSAGPYEYKSFQVGKRMFIDVKAVKRDKKKSKPKTQK
ncbi:MAG TPA: AMIN domain-containing protein, partial [Gammaproteobacteria bacterium]|nr:AMIN domain-containing protein [Gammaproteobacteria bacterium]